MRRNSAFLLIYAVILAVTSLSFLALDDAPDPSRRTDRILNVDAGRIALALMKERDAKFHDYDVVHVAHAPKGKGRAEARWIVLLDHENRTALRDAVVVELKSSDGTLLRVRKPA